MPSASWAYIKQRLPPLEATAHPFVEAPGVVIQVLHNPVVTKSKKKMGKIGKNLTSTLANHRFDTILLLKKQRLPPDGGSRAPLRRSAGVCDDEDNI